MSLLGVSKGPSPSGCSAALSLVHGPKAPNFSATVSVDWPFHFLKIINVNLVPRFSFHINRVSKHRACTRSVSTPACASSFRLHLLRHSIFACANSLSSHSRARVDNNMTRNNPSPSGLRAGLESPQKKTRTRTRKQPVKAAKKATVSDASDSEGEVATMSQPPTQSQSDIHPFAYEPHPSAPRHPQSALSQSIEPAEPRSIAALPARRHNTRSSSRSVSPSLLPSHLPNGRNSNPKSKGKGRARSTSASSTHQGVEASKARGGKGKADSEQDDGDERQTSNKRTKAINLATQPIKKATGVKKAAATKKGEGQKSRYMGLSEKLLISAHLMSLPEDVLGGTVLEMIKADQPSVEVNLLVQVVGLIVNMK